MIPGQTLALALDAYRDLQSRKMFWITIGLTLCVAAVVAVLGVNDQGLQIAFWTLPTGEFISAKTVTPAEFYTMLFVSFGLKFWLAWIASVLALISTADLFPGLMREGAVDTQLTRPIGRGRFFLTRWALGLLFALAQVLVFVVPLFFIIGIRGGAWRPGLLLAVPLVMVTYSSLWALSTFFGVLTRSTLAAFLITLLCWGGAGLVNAVDEGMLGIPGLTGIRAMYTVRAEETRRVSAAVAGKDRAGVEAALKADPSLALSIMAGGLEDAVDHAADGDPAPLRTRLEENEATALKLDRYAFALSSVRFFLPKSEETVELTRRWTLRAADLQPEAEKETPEAGAANTDQERARKAVREWQRRIERRRAELTAARPAWLILSSSFAFTAVFLALALWLFKRRDF